MFGWQRIQISRPPNPNLLSLEFSESPDRWGINLAARTYKTNKAPTVVC